MFSARFVLSFTFVVIVSGRVVGQAPASIEHFEKKVRPVLAEHCFSCHGSDPKKIKGGLIVTSRAKMLTGGDSGPAIDPGHPDKSLLIQTLGYDGELKMPPKGKLKDHEIEAITYWVKGGAAWPDAPDYKPTPAATSGPLFSKEQKEFWAFMPVQDVAPPHVKKKKWVQTPIDAFILARLEGQKLSPAPPATKRDLIRRVTFDLTGLPPTPQEVEGFVGDESPSAFAKIVDRLLATPAYGERWGRHWLDVARYAESNGLDENTAFANAWRYRDYVIRAFNSDKPFDEFVREQIAGDLLPPSSDKQVQSDRLTALGYLAIGPKLLAEPDKQKMLLDIADEQLDTIGRGLMGLTLGCARCHDHKFDPLPQRDYYSLLAIFTSTRTMRGLETVAMAFERPMPTIPDEVTHRFVELEKRLDAVLRLNKRVKDAARKESDRDRRKFVEKQSKILEYLADMIRKATPKLDTMLSVEEGSANAYGTQPRNLFVQVRGNYLTPGEEAPAIFPRIIAGEKQKPFVATSLNSIDAPQPTKTRFGEARSKSGRWELAQWLTDPRHPLTARVFVNRVWKHHFGEGLVRSPDNFGRLGERPTHPELLDWLATRFVEDGWSVKSLHRRILLSSTYQMAIVHNEKAARTDPDSRLLWRFPRRRLEAEAIRDSMLAVAGNLDRTPCGSLLKSNNFQYVAKDAAAYDGLRRSIYLPMVRNDVFAFFQAFDFPDPSVAIGKRVDTVVAPQALYLMNNPVVMRQSEVFATRLFEKELTSEERVSLAYRLALSRDATSEETARALRFVSAYTATGKGTERQAWIAFCQAIFSSNEFIYLN